MKTSIATNEELRETRSDLLFQVKARFVLVGVLLWVLEGGECHAVSIIAVRLRPKRKVDVLRLSAVRFGSPDSL
jgi:hypothetical protein